MSLSLDVLYDTVDNGRRIVIASLPDTPTIIEAEKAYGPICGGNAKRVREIYGSRILAAQLYPDAVIGHGQNGEPFLSMCEEYGEISISHTSDKVAMIFSNENTGIDIERTDRKIGRVAGRFLSEEERSMIGEQGLSAAWCAKEAFYKYIKGDGVVFLNEYTIVFFNPDNIIIEHKGKKFDISVLTVGDITLAYI